MNRSAAEVPRTPSQSASTSSKLWPYRFIHLASSTVQELSPSSFSLWITHVDNLTSEAAVWRFGRPGDRNAIRLRGGVRRGGRPSAAARVDDAPGATRAPWAARVTPRGGGR